MLEKIRSVGAVNSVVLARVLRTSTKKRSSPFSRKKSAPPQRKSWLCIYGRNYVVTCMITSGDVPRLSKANGEWFEVGCTDR